MGDYWEGFLVGFIGACLLMAAGAVAVFAVFWMLVTFGGYAVATIVMLMIATIAGLSFADDQAKKAKD